MRKNIVKRKRRNIFEMLGIKQDNKKWLVLAITFILTGYILFSLIYAPISCIVNVKANAEMEDDYKEIYTTNSNNEFIIELPTIYYIRNGRALEASKTTKYIINTLNERITTSEGETIIARNYNESEEFLDVANTILASAYYDELLQKFNTDLIPITLWRKQIGNINLEKLREFKILQNELDTNRQIGFKAIIDEENYIEYWIEITFPGYIAYWNIEEETIEETIGLFIYKDRNDITGQYAKDYWEQYFINNETFKNTYRNYWYDYYYQSIYNKGLEAGQTYSEMTFYTLIDAVTFGAIKPIYSILNFELLGINMWNLATSIFTILIVVIIIKFIGMVV